MYYFRAEFLISVLADSSSYEDNVGLISNMPILGAFNSELINKAVWFAELGTQRSSAPV